MTENETPLSKLAEYEIPQSKLIEKETPQSIISAIKTNLHKDPKCWEDRKKLVEKLAAVEAESLEDAVYALLDRAGDESREVRISALRALITNLNNQDKEFLQKRRFGINVILMKYFNRIGEDSNEYKLVLNILDHTSWQIQREFVFKVIETLEKNESSEIRHRAAEWLGEKAGPIAEEESFDDFIYVMDALRNARDKDPITDVRDIARSSLFTLKQIRIKTKRHQELKKLIQMNGDFDITRMDDEDSFAQAIFELADPSLGTREELRSLVDVWIAYIENDKDPRLVELISEAIRYNWFAVLPLVEKLLSKQGHEVPLNIRKRIIMQLADMSDPRFFDLPLQQITFNGIREKLEMHAVPVLSRQIASDGDTELREQIVRLLGYTGSREGIDALVAQVVGKETARSGRQNLMAEYYLEPSKKRGEQAGEILDGVIVEAKRTLRTLQSMNIGIFLVGLLVLTLGLYLSMTSEGAATRIASGLGAIGGFTGIIIRLIKDPLDRIQNSMSDLTQVEAAFTGFIWSLNLNGTFIQSEYIANGKLTNAEIKKTVDRIENAMEVTMNLVSTYTESGEPRVISNIYNLEPGVARVGEDTVTIYGKNLYGDSNQKKERTGMVAINHRPVRLDNNELDWKNHQVKFKLPGGIPGGSARVSLFIDGIETNAIPLYIVDGDNR